jgi:hypothetical protein
MIRSGGLRALNARIDHDISEDSSTRMKNAIVRVHRSMYHLLSCSSYPLNRKRAGSKRPRPSLGATLRLRYELVKSCNVSALAILKEDSGEDSTNLEEDI